MPFFEGKINMKFGLADKQIEQILAILKKANVTEAVIFGSRAKGNWRENSDIDIAVWGQDINLGKLSLDLEELPMPYKFDVINYDKISNSAFREHIDRVGINFYEE